jgi:DNA processing protein
MEAGLLTAKADFQSRRYTPPSQWQSAPVSELLAESSRAAVTPAQLHLLASGKRPSDEEMTVFVAGDVTLLKKRCVSIIGTRKVSAEGAARARRLARELASNDVVIVSGLAEGVDTNAMTAAIGNGGRTIGVIGTPLNKAYPAQNAELQEEIYRDHLLVSQFDSRDKVFKSNFPQRNRLMAMLSDATVVIEASDTSGTLHQAAECVRLERWLFIAKSVVEDTTLAWPKKFLGYPRCRALSHSSEILSAVYG